jgi:large subunit ribosomal protein L9
LHDPARGRDIQLQEGFFPMKVLLLNDVYKHGVAGEVVDVSDGFARNWLLPKKLGVKATPSSLKQAADLRAKSEARRAQLDERLNDLARQIDGIELFFGRRASPTGKLFGSVTTSEVAEELNKKTGIDINRRRISQHAIRDVGTHEVPVRLGSEISPVLKITVVREEEFARYMAKREADEKAGLGEAVGDLASAVAHGVADTVSSAAGTVSSAAEGVAEAVSSAAEGVAEAVSSVVEKVKDALPGGGHDEQEDTGSTEQASE